MPEIQFDTYTKYKTKKVIPNAVDMAQKLITDNPELFKDCFDTKYKIAVMMHEYADKCCDFTSIDLSVIQNELAQLNNLSKNTTP